MGSARFHLSRPARWLARLDRAVFLAEVRVGLTLSSRIKRPAQLRGRAIPQFTFTYAVKVSQATQQRLTHSTAALYDVMQSIYVARSPAVRATTFNCQIPGGVASYASSNHFY